MAILVYIKKLLYFCSPVLLTIILSSCATVMPPSARQVPQAGQPICSLGASNIVHIVASGETLWHISKTYGIPMEDIIQANSLRKANQLEKGQRLILPLGKETQLEKGRRLVIPNTATVKAAIPLYLSCKWGYIVIHHSATEEGDAYQFNILHKLKGWDGIGYDFVVDNGSDGKEDGAIEVTPRWTKQENGAHCHASDMNSKGIGICLVGNFSEEKVSEKQLNSLVYMVNVLRKYYKIPINHIMGHGQVPGARTECPGKYFPWQEFRKRLESCG